MESEKPAHRIPLSIEVDFRKSYSRSQAKGMLKNISLSGAFLEHAEGDLKPGSKVQLTFNVGSRIRKLQAEIIWANKEGAGVKFNHTNNRDIQIIDDLMYFVENRRESQHGIFDNILKKVS